MPTAAVTTATPVTDLRFEFAPLPAAALGYAPAADAQTIMLSTLPSPATQPIPGVHGKPLVSIAGTLDAFITPENHAVAYARAIERANCSALHQLFLVEGGTHVDTFAAFGYGLQAQAPFAWAAFDRLVRTVEHADAPGDGAIRKVRTPREIL